jgi:hypothetical protein
LGQHHQRRRLHAHALRRAHLSRPVLYRRQVSSPLISNCDAVSFILQCGGYAARAWAARALRHARCSKKHTEIQFTQLTRFTGADLQMIDDVMQSPLLNVVVQRHMRDLTKEVAAKEVAGGHSASASFGECAGAECLSACERPVHASPLAALQQQQQQQHNVVCVTSPCPSCYFLVHQLRRQVADLQAAALSHAAVRPVRPFPAHAVACPPPVNSSHMTIRCIDGRTVQVCTRCLPVPAARTVPAATTNHLLSPLPPLSHIFLRRFIFRTSLRRNAAVCTLPAKRIVEGEGVQRVCAR